MLYSGRDFQIRILNKIIHAFIEERMKKLKTDNAKLQ